METYGHENAVSGGRAREIEKIVEQAAYGEMGPAKESTVGGEELPPGVREAPLGETA